MKPIVELDKVSVELPYRSTNVGLLKNAFFKKQHEDHATLKILDKINLKLYEGDRIGLVGQNGAGKTTLLRVIATVLPITSGNIRINGTVLPLLNARGNIHEQLTCMENIRLSALRNKLTGEKYNHYIKEVIYISDLQKFIHSPVRILSAGMKNRLLLSMFYADKSDIIVMDEWIGASDQKVLQSKEGLLHNIISSSKVFVIASHREKIIKEHCNKIIRMQGGEISAIEKI